MIDVETKLEVLDLLARASYALDERDLPALEACFGQSAVMEVDIAGGAGPMRFEGREGIMGLMRDSMEAQTDKRRHVTTNTIFLGEDGGALTLVSNLTLTAVEDGAIRLVTSGLYRDRVHREGDRWVIAERRIDLDAGY